MTAALGSARADRVAARATGVGVGLLAFMIAWLIGARVTEQVWGPPSSAVVALAISVMVGIFVAVVAGQRLLRRQFAESQLTRDTSPRTATQQH
jgi:hypothetical protein